MAMNQDSKGSQKTYTGCIKLVHRGGAERLVHMVGWAHEINRARRSFVTLNLGKQAGLIECSLAHGWCSKPCDDWRLDDDDWDTLLAWAEEYGGRRIAKTKKSPGRPRGKRQPKEDPRQEHLF